MNKQLVWIVLRLALGAMWCLSSFTKLWDLDVFVRNVRNYKFPFVDVAPGDVALGYGLPWLELLLGVLLIVGVWLRASYILTIGLFSLFLMGVSYAGYYGLKISCGCFGSGGAPISKWHYLGLTLGLAYTCLLLHRECKNKA